MQESEGTEEKCSDGEAVWLEVGDSGGGGSLGACQHGPPIHFRIFISVAPWRDGFDACQPGREAFVHVHVHVLILISSTSSNMPQGKLQWRGLRR